MTEATTPTPEEETDDPALNHDAEVASQFSNLIGQFVSLLGPKLGVSPRAAMAALTEQAVLVGLIHNDFDFQTVEGQFREAAKTAVQHFREELPKWVEKADKSGEEVPDDLRRAIRRSQGVFDA